MYVQVGSLLRFDKIQKTVLKADVKGYLPSLCDWKFDFIVAGYISRRA